VTFFAQSYEGEVHITEDGIPNVQFPFKSFITIDTNVEFFSEEYYQGDSFCYDAYDCRGKVCYGGYWDSDDLPFNPSLAKSARIGCPVIIEEYNKVEQNVRNRH